MPSVHRSRHPPVGAIQVSDRRAEAAWTFVGLPTHERVASLARCLYDSNSTSDLSCTAVSLLSKVRGAII